jgi:hypothetical protein
MASDTIGILTFHRCINYGSYWQARCLVEGLRARGHDAVLLDHHSREVTWAEWRCAFQPLLPRRTSRADQRDYGRKARRFLAAFAELPLSPAFALDAPGAMQPCRTVVVGSDEVWNLTHPWYGGRPLFYGEGLSAQRMVSYAASFGNYDAAAGLDGSWRQRLGRFDAISVRDENSRALVHQALGREPPLVLDPVLQFPAPAMVPGATPAIADRPYIAVYGHGMPAWFEARVAAAARGAGYRTVSVGYRNDFADEQRLDAGPEEFARIMAGAAAVATNFFHGCVFALLHGKPFACAPSPYRFNKVRDLTGALGATRHLATEADGEENVTQLLTQPLAPAIPAALARLRAASDDYLAAALA